MRKRVVISLLFIVLVLPGLVSAATPRNQIGFHPELDVDVWVYGLSWYVVYFSDLDAGDTIYVEVEVTSGSGIDFFICNQANYAIFEALGSPYVYQQEQSVGSVSTSFTVPTSEAWYCVFLNDALLTSKHLEGYVGTTPPFPIGGDLLFAIVILISAVVIGGAIWFGLKRTKQSKAASSQTTPYPSYTAPTHVSTETNFCPYCGTTRQSSDSRFCANCGRSFTGPELG